MRTSATKPVPCLERIERLPREGWEGYCVEQATLPGVEARAEKQGRRFYTSADGSSAGSEGESGSRSIASSSGSVMRRDLRKVRSDRRPVRRSKVDGSIRRQTGPRLGRRESPDPDLSHPLRAA